MPLRFGSIVFVFLTVPGHAWPQQFVLGIKAGVRVTDDLNGFSLGSAESKRYIVRPALDVNLPLHFGLEVDALYRTFGYTSFSGNFAGFSINRERSNSWEFPVLGKCRIPLRVLHPFAGAGFNTRTVAGTIISSGSYRSGLGGPDIAVFNQRRSTNYPVTHGLVVSGGLEWKMKRIRISPEVRYQRWNSIFLDEFGGDGSYSLHSNQNEVFLMLGLSWH